MVERRQSLVSRTIKKKIPRRESERRSHPLARHCEILAALETRISMLSMTFMKFIETGMCCFIPGKIIDEILHILRVVQRSESPPRTHDLLQELRDISSMAMEHFEEHIVPSLRESDANNVALKKRFFQSQGYSRAGRPINISDIIRKEFKTIHQNTKAYRQQIGGMRKSFHKVNTKVKSQGSVIAYQACKLREQRRLINEQAVSISEMKNQLEEFERKFADLTLEINRQKTTDNKASQTNELKDDITHSNILKSLNEVNDQCRSMQHLSDDIMFNSRENVYSPSNIQPRLSIRSHKYSTYSTYRDLPTRPRVHDWYMKSIHLPNRRITISDFRASQNSKQERPVEDTVTKELAKGTQNRKRKLMDLITKVVDLKIPKLSSLDDAQLELNKLLKNMNNSASKTASPSDIIDVESSRSKKRIQSHPDALDEIPIKRVSSVSRSMDK